MLSVHRWLIAVVLAFGWAGGGAARSDQVKLDVSPSYDVLQAGQKQTTWIRVGVTGFALPSESQRASVNDSQPPISIPSMIVEPVVRMNSTWSRRMPLSST